MCIETYLREGNCLCDEFSRYEYVDSISTVHELARLFQVVVATRVENPDATWDSAATELYDGAPLWIGWNQTECLRALLQP